MLTTAVPATVAVFCSLAEQIQSESSLTIKTEIIRGFLKRFSGDVVLLFSLLLPKYNGRLYHMQDKQLIKVLAMVLKIPENTLKTDLQSTGCIGQTAIKYFHNAKPHSNMTLAEFDQHLTNLSNASGDLGQSQAINNFLQFASKKDFFMFLREVKQDIRLGAGIRTVLTGLHESASDMFKNCANVKLVVQNVLAGKTDPNAVKNQQQQQQQSPNKGNGGIPSLGKGGSANMNNSNNNDNNEDDDGSNLAAGSSSDGITLGVPIGPMLAAPSKGCAQVIAKCPNGAFSETKYDGERIQIHKNANNKYSFFARSLKPMKADKYEGLEEFIYQSVPDAKEIILDGEILLYDMVKKQPLPFGTLGKHKKLQFTEACTCIFIFDILYLNGQSLLKMPMHERRELMCKTIRVIPNRILLSELREIKGTMERKTTLLKAHLNQAVKEGLEGLVVKDIMGEYHPRSRHWIKLKKDYLDGCADTCDLVCLGGWYGSGTKGGLLNTFLVGCLDTSLPAGANRRWKTVTKVTNGLDDMQLARLNNHIRNNKLMTPCTKATVPMWLDVNSAHVPDVVVVDPTQSMIFEIMTTEFSKTKRHTANQISMRFPRIKQQRDDKTWKEATNLEELEKLVIASKENNDGLEILSASDDDCVDEEEQQRKYTRVDPKFLAQRVLGEKGEVAIKYEKLPDENFQPQQNNNNNNNNNNNMMMMMPQQGTTNSNVNRSPVQKPQQQQQQQQQPKPTTINNNNNAAAVKYSSLNIPANFIRAFPHAHIHFHDVTTPIVIHHNHHNQRAPDGRELVTSTSENILIIHCVALKGKWMSNRGVMGSISLNLGTKAQKAYEATCHKANLGNVAFVNNDYNPANGTATDLHIGNMYVMDEIGGGSNNKSPMIELQHLDTALGKVVQHATAKKCQVHFALPSDSRSVQDWVQFANILVKHFSSANNATVPCALYIRGDKKFGHPLYYREPSSSQQQQHQQQQQQQKPAAASTSPSGEGDDSASSSVFYTKRQLETHLQRQNTDYERDTNFFGKVVAAVLYNEDEAKRSDDYSKRYSNEFKDLKNTLAVLDAEELIVVKNSSDPALTSAASRVTHFVKTSTVTPMFITSLPPPSQRSYVIVNRAWIRECSKQNKLLPPPKELNPSQQDVTASNTLNADEEAKQSSVDKKKQDDDQDTESYYNDDDNSSSTSSEDTADYHFGDEDDENGGAVTPPDFSENDNDDDDENSKNNNNNAAPLASCRIAFDRNALGGDETDKLTGIAISAGATVHPRVRGLTTEKDSKTTHFVSVDTQVTAEARRALDMSVPAVGPGWIHDCVQKKKLIKVSAEYIVGNGNNNKKPSNTNNKNEDAAEQSPASNNNNKKPQQQHHQQKRRARTPDFTHEADEMRRRDEQLTRKSHASAQLQLFTNYRIFISGYAPNLRDTIDGVLAKGGATILNHVPTTQPNDRNFRSLIIADTLTPEVQHALQSSTGTGNINIPVVSRMWIDESLKKNQLEPYQNYVYQLHPQDGRFEAQCWKSVTSSTGDDNKKSTNGAQEDRVVAVVESSDDESTLDYENDNREGTPVDDDDANNNNNDHHQLPPLNDVFLTIASTNHEVKDRLENLARVELGAQLIDWVGDMRVSPSQRNILVIINKDGHSVDLIKAKHRISQIANPAYKTVKYVSSEWLEKCKKEGKVVDTSSYLL